MLCFAVVWLVHLCQLEFPFILHNEGGDRPADSRIAQRTDSITAYLKTQESMEAPPLPQTQINVR